MEQRIKSSAKVKGLGAKYQGKVTTLQLKHEGQNIFYTVLVI